MKLLVQELVKTGYDVHLLVFHRGEDVELPGVQIHRAPAPWGVHNIPPSISWKKIVCDIFFKKGLLFYAGIDIHWFMVWRNHIPMKLYSYLGSGKAVLPSLKVWLKVSLDLLSDKELRLGIGKVGKEEVEKNIHLVFIKRNEEVFIVKPWTI